MGKELLRRKVASKRRALLGKRFGKLVVTRFRNLTPAGHSRWCVKCDCGRTAVVLGSNLRRAHTSSCGCDRGRPGGGALERHGHRPKGSRTLTYTSWCSMKYRCLNPKATGYENYGGRGIRVCRRWMKYQNFLADMGERPSLDLTLDRKNVDGNYNKRNCRWATKSQQQYNRRRW